MEPAFQRGDVLLLDNNRAEIAVGDIVVFKIAGRDIPIVHRVLRAHVRVANASTVADEAADYLTKGDNNAVARLALSSATAGRASRWASGSMRPAACNCP
jgi:signal peptidase